MKTKDKLLIAWSVFWGIWLLMVILSLFGCYTGHSYHRERAKPETARQKAARKPVTYQRCDENGCKIYDTKGNRRYDLESPHAH